MPDDLQPGQHLSPDQLGAFAENALPAHERLAALAHLSACTDCRQAVFLIQQSDPALTITVPETPRRTWFTLPQIFAASTAALACSLILALILHNHHQEPQPITTAKLQAPIAPPPPATTAAPSSTAVTPPKPEADKSVQLTQTSTHTHLPEPAKLKPQPLPEKFIAPQPRIGASAGISSGRFINSAQQPLEAKAAANAFAAPASSAQASSGIGGAVPLPAPPPPESRALRAYAADNLQKDLPPASTSAALAPLAPPGSTMDSSAVIVNGASIQGIPLDANARLDSITAAAPIKLPSKLPVASQLNSTGRTLVLDTAGSLFLSLDHGKHWTTVNPQWSGKAVRITLAAAPARLYQVQPQQAQTQQAPVASATFELTTTTGDVWVSTDGLTWHTRK